MSGPGLIAKTAIQALPADGGGETTPRDDGCVGFYPYIPGSIGPRSGPRKALAGHPVGFSVLVPVHPAPFGITVLS
jgi:hypothetical protein